MRAARGPAAYSSAHSASTCGGRSPAASTTRIGEAAQTVADLRQREPGRGEERGELRLGAFPASGVDEHRDVTHHDAGRLGCGHVLRHDRLDDQQPSARAATTYGNSSSSRTQVSSSQSCRMPLRMMTSPLGTASKKSPFSIRHRSATSLEHRRSRPRCLRPSRRAHRERPGCRDQDGGQQGAVSAADVHDGLPGEVERDQLRDLAGALAHGGVEDRRQLLRRGEVLEERTAVHVVPGGLARPHRLGQRAPRLPGRRVAQEQHARPDRAG